MFFKRVLVIIMISGNLYSQKSYTLEQCINKALANNIAIQLVEANSATAYETVKQSYRSLLPTIGAGANYNIRYGRSVDPNTNTISNTDFFSNNYSIEASLSLFQGFMKQHQIKLAKWNKLVANEEIKQQRFITIQQLLPVFFEALYAQDLIKISEEEQQIADKLFELSSKKYALGLQSKAELINVEADVQAAHLNLLKSKNALSKTILKISFLMNTEANIVSFKNELISNQLASKTKTDINTTNSLESLPVFKQLSFTQHALRKELHISQSKLYPALSAFTGYTTGFFETNSNPITGQTIKFQKQLTDNASQYIGVALDIPIFSQWNLRSNIKQQRLNLEQGELQIKQKEQEINQLISQILQEKQALEAELIWGLKKEKAIALSFKTTEKKFNHGLVSLLDVLQIKNELFKTKIENLRVQQQLEMNIKMKDLYTGKFNNLL